MSKTKFTLEDLFNLKGAVIYNPDVYKPTPHVSIDTRTLRKGSIYVAIKGKRFDGHDFVAEAVKKGAGAVIVSRKKLGMFDDVDTTIVTVPNTVKAYGELARIKRIKMGYLVVAITGSNGKTTTKELAAALLSEKFKTSKTEANNNNQIGVPLTILSASPGDEALVVELGTNHFGEIAYLADIALPDIALITNIGNAHVKFLKDKKGVFSEKISLFDKTNERGGKVLVNIDDGALKRVAGKYEKSITFGFGDNAEIKGEVYGYDAKGFPKVRINYGKKEISFVLRLAGESNLKNALAAVAVAFAAGLNKTQIKKGATKFSQVKGRFEIMNLKKVTVINDAYNASPESMRSSLESFAKISSERKIAILGDMLELGEKSGKFHKELASILRKGKFDEVLLLGNEMKSLLNTRGVNAKHFRGVKRLIKYLDSCDLARAYILVKASHGMKLESVINYLTEKYG